MCFQRLSFARQCAHWIHFDDLVGHRVTRDIEPAPAAGGVPPSFQKQAFRIVAQEQVISELGIADAVFSKRTRDMRLAAAGKFAFLARANMGS